MATEEFNNRVQYKRDTATNFESNDQKFSDNKMNVLVTGG